MEITVMVNCPYRSNTTEWTLWTTWNMTKNRIHRLEWDKDRINRELKAEEEKRITYEKTLKSLDPEFDPKKDSGEEKKKETE